MWKYYDKNKLKSYLRAMRYKGKDPFVQYQEGKCSKGFLLDLIVEKVGEYLEE